MTVAERERLGQRYAAELAPRLRSAVDREDVDRIADLTAGLGHQELLALVVVLASQWPTKRCRKLVVCRGCGEYERHEGEGYCRACHGRWDAAGRPESGPPPAVPAEVSGWRGALHLVEGKADRLEEYAHLAAFGISDEEAAERLGVSVATVADYRLQLQREPLQLRIPGDDRRKAS